MQTSSSEACFCERISGSRRVSAEVPLDDDGDTHATVSAVVVLHGDEYEVLEHTLRIERCDGPVLAATRVLQSRLAKDERSGRFGVLDCLCEQAQRVLR